MAKWYGSVHNRIMENSVTKEPITIGMGATLISYSDRHAATVVGIEQKGKTTIIKVQQDHAKRIDKNGMSESQNYVFTPNKEAYVHIFKKTGDKPFVECRANEKTGRLVKCGGGILLGHRDEYYDFSF